MDPENEALQHRLANIESTLKQILELLQSKRRKAIKRERNDTQRAYQAVVASGFKPTEEQLRAARRSLARATRRR